MFEQLSFFDIGGPPIEWTESAYECLNYNKGARKGRGCDFCVMHNALNRKDECHMPEILKKLLGRRGKVPKRVSEILRNE